LTIEKAQADIVTAARERGRLLNEVVNCTSRASESTQYRNLTNPIIELSTVNDQSLETSPPDIVLNKQALEAFPPDIVQEAARAARA